MAETLDFLGTTAIIACDLVAASDYYRQAAALFAELDDRQGVVSALGTYCACGHAAAWVDCAALRPAEPQTYVGEGERAHQLAQAIHWRAGSAYTAYTLGLALAGGGQYGPSLQYARASLALAADIEHHEWSASARWLLGWVRRDLHDAAGAAQHLTRGLELARSVGSSYWIARLTADLARSEVLRGNLETADSLLRPLLPGDGPLQDVGDRRITLAWAELALARGAPAEALIVLGII